MNKYARSAASEKLRERIVFIDILKRQMLDLSALRKKVAEAEMRTTAMRIPNSRRGCLSSGHAPKIH
jgi:hypothetical protein